jgi:hypothetical protein
MSAPFQQNGSRLSAARSRYNEDEVRAVLEGFLAGDLHAKRILSLANATFGVMASGSLAIHAIGEGLAFATQRDAKHAVKQVDRLLSNDGIDTWALFKSWVPFVLGDRTEAMVALDWTDFDKDGHSTIALYLLTDHGRATPLLWLTVTKGTLKNRRNDYEDQLLLRLHEVLPAGVQVTIVADRGFSDTKLFEFLEDQLHFHYLIRTRSNIFVQNAQGERRKARDWVSRSGRANKFREAKITAAEYPVTMVITVKARGMKDPWLLVSDLDLPPKEAIGYYGRRFTIEEGFRDLKDPRYGMGLSQTRIGRTDRRDRLILIASFAIALLSLLGAAGEELGFDRYLKVNTSKKRTMSLVRQGKFWFDQLPTMREERFQPLFKRFSEMVDNIQFCREIFGLI